MQLEMQDAAISSLEMARQLNDTDVGILINYAIVAKDQTLLHEAIEQ